MDDEHWTETTIGWLQLSLHFFDKVITSSPIHFINVSTKAVIQNACF